MDCSSALRRRPTHALCLSACAPLSRAAAPTTTATATTANDSAAVTALQIYLRCVRGLKVSCSRALAANWPHRGAAAATAATTAGGKDSRARGETDCAARRYERASEQETEKEGARDGERASAQLRLCVCACMLPARQLGRIHTISVPCPLTPCQYQQCISIYVICIGIHNWYSQWVRRMWTLPYRIQSARAHERRSMCRAIC